MIIIRHTRSILTGFYPDACAMYPHNDSDKGELTVGSLVVHRLYGGIGIIVQDALSKAIVLWSVYPIEWCEMLKSLKG